MVLDKPHIFLNSPTFLKMTRTSIKMSSVLFETEQYVSRATVSFQHLTGYIEQIARLIIFSVLSGSQDILEISRSLWNLDSLDKTPTGLDNSDSFPPWQETF
jgi:hypothetical protein